MNVLFRSIVNPDSGPNQPRTVRGGVGGMLVAISGWPQGGKGSMSIPKKRTL